MNKRNNEEAEEKLQNVVNEAPADKYQNAQQIAPSTGFKTNAGDSSFVPDKHEVKGSKLKQEVAAKVIRDAAVGGSLSGDGASFGLRVASGSIGGILGAANAAPVAGQSRGKDRVTKKNDRNSTKLNFIPNDQVLVEWDESKPLAESKDSDQGFNGTYRNEYARLQKNKEAVPGGLMFDRSVDLLVKDNIYFGQGQVVRQSGVTTNADLDQVAKPGVLGVYDYPSSESSVNYNGGAVSNYICDSVDFQLDSNGKPVYFVYNETDLGCTVDQFDANKSSAQDHILMNDAELVRETMDTKAGDEKADIWTPLARAVRKPTQLNGFLRDIEAGTGNEVATAYRKASTSMAFQLNRAHKDGQDAVNPAISALIGLNKNYVSKAAQKNDVGTDIAALFNATNYRNGEAVTMIPLYDSTGKYNSKADFLIQPRGFRMHLQTADNNIDPLYVSKLFTQAYDNQEVFSTIDREFDPMSPVCMTDKAAVIHRLSWHKLGSYVNSAVAYKIDDVGAVSTSHKVVLIPAVMADELKASGLNVYLFYPKEAIGNIDVSSNVFTPSSTFEFANGDIFRVIISELATTDVGFSDLYDSATEGYAALMANDIVESTAITYDGKASASHCFYPLYASVLVSSHKVYPYLGGPAVYCYSDLRNTYVVEVDHPLLKGLDDYLIQQIGPKFESITHNPKTDNYIQPINIKTVHSTMYFSLWSFLICAATPYIVKARINSLRDVLYYTQNVEYPYSSTLLPIKEVTTKSYSNFNYQDYDTELSSGIMTPATAITWILPETYQQVGYASSEAKVLMPWYTNQNEIRYINGSYSFDDDASAMSFPSIRSGVRLASLDTLYGMSEKDVRLSLDKIASFKSLNPTLSNSATYKYSSVGDGQMILSVAPAIMTASEIVKLPRELGFFMTAPYGTLTPDYNHDRDWSTSVLGATSFRCYYWYGENPEETDSNGTQRILEAITINVNRATNFKQDWYAVLASGTIPAVDHGFFLSANHAFSQGGALLTGRTQFKPYASLADNGTASTTNTNYLRSLQKVFWTRIQKLPFVISPFDGLTIDNSGTPNNVIVTDPYDILYVFGLGGFRASDFRESVYNREKEVVNQGLTFVSDPWIEDSPVFKEGAMSSGIKVSKGFEL